MLQHAIPLFIYYAFISTFTVLIYASDKSAARRHGRRIPERNLHLLSITGGWPGAMLAQHRLRHKSRKPAFQRLFYLTIVINLLLLYLLLTILA